MNVLVFYRNINSLFEILSEVEASISKQKTVNEFDKGY